MVAENENMLLALCPCCSGQPYSACCMPYCEGGEAAPTAEALMRSRYTAFVRRDEPYLLKTWHAKTKPASLDMDDYAQVQWTGLEVLATEAGGEGEQVGTVEYIARFTVQGQVQRLHEVSHFVCEEGQWFYVDGEIMPQQPLRREKVGRNSPCPCGSGKKFKRCCL